MLVGGGGQLAAICGEIATNVYRTPRGSGREWLRKVGGGGRRGDWGTCAVWAAGC